MSFFTFSFLIFGVFWGFSFGVLLLFVQIPMKHQQQTTMRVSSTRRDPPTIAMIMGMFRFSQYVPDTVNGHLKEIIQWVI